MPPILPYWCPLVAWAHYAGWAASQGVFWWGPLDSRWVWDLSCCTARKLGQLEKGSLGWRDPGSYVGWDGQALWATRSRQGHEQGPRDYWGPPPRKQVLLAI